MANGNFGGGDGSLQYPFLIEDADDFYNIRENPYAFYKLTNSINLMECSYLGTNGWVPSIFIGELEGNGFTIEGCKILSGTQLGLFSVLRGKVRNVQLRNFDIKNTVNNSSGRAGALAGTIEHLDGITVENCSVIESKIEGRTIGSFAGEIVSGEIHNSYSKCELISENQTTSIMGGIVGSITSNASIKAPVFKNVYFSGEDKSTHSNGTRNGLVGSRAQSPVIIHSFYKAESLSKDSNADRDYKKTDEELKTPDTYVDWDIPMANHIQKVWAITEGAYPELYFNSESRFLVFANGKYLKLAGDEWEELSEELPSEEVFEGHGMSDGELAGVPGYVWNKLRIHRTIELVNLRDRYRVDSIFDHKVMENKGQITDGFLLSATINLDEYGDSLGRVYFK